MNVSRDSVISVTRSSPQAIFATSPLKPRKFSNRFMYVSFDTECTQDLESMKELSNMYRNLYVPRIRVHSANPLMT
jgi:hypothetical protein